jgi:hypothetical protein
VTSNPPYVIAPMFYRPNVGGVLCHLADAGLMSGP